MARPSDKDLADLTWLLSRLRESEDFCRPYFDRAKRYYRLYRFGSSVDDDQWPYVNRSYSKDILAFVEDTTALMVQTLFATLPFIEAQERRATEFNRIHSGIDSTALRRQIVKAIDYQVTDEGTEFFEEIVDFFKGGAMMGNAYMGVYPRYAPGTREYVGPLLKAHDFWDTLPIPFAKRMSRAKGVFIREWESKESLKELAKQGVYKNVDSIKSIEGTGADPELDWHNQLLKDVGIQDWLPMKGDIEIIHYISGGHIITFADRRRIIRNSNNGPKPYPYDIPVVQYKYMPIPCEFFAMGIPEVLETLQEDKNLLRSAVRDNIDLVVNKIIKFRQDADIQTDLIKYYAGAMWPLENINDLEVLDQGDVTQSSFLEIQNRTYDMENALSLFGYARGQTPAHSEQPTTVMKLQQASLNRTDLAVKLAEFGALQNIANRIVLLTRQFMTQEMYEDIIGEEDAGFYQLSLGDIQKFFYFKPIGSSVTHIKEIRQQQIQAALQLAMGLPPEMMANNVEPFAVNWYEALMTGFESLDVKNRERILVKLQQQQGLPPELEALAMGMGGMGGGMGGMESPFGDMAGELAALGEVPYGE